MKILTLHNSCTGYHQACYHILLVLAVLMSGSIVSAQEEAATDAGVKPVKNTFESIWFMDHQTVMVPIPGTFEMDFQHRFGTWDRGYDDFYGVFAPSNMRIGLDYVPFERIMVGIGFTKKDLLWDFNGKYALLRQGRGGGSPLSVTYYVNAAVDTRKRNKTNYSENSDRWSFFHQLMIARKLTESLSLQVYGNLSWFNFKEQVYDGEGIDLGRDENEHFAVGALARWKFSNTMGVMVAYDHPITDHAFFNPEPNLSIGLEFVTSSHAFQVFVGNYHSLIPQYNSTYNENSFGDNEILIGFNITRLWNF